jgi:hypothetical protein
VELTIAVGRIEIPINVIILPTAEMDTVSIFMLPADI